MMLPQENSFLWHKIYMVLKILVPMFQVECMLLSHYVP